MKDPNPFIWTVNLAVVQPCSETSRVFEQCDHEKMQYIQCTSEDVMSGKKMKRTSKRISEIDSTTFSVDGLY